MSDMENYRMALDMLRCHLGLSEDEAKAQLGLADDTSSESAFDVSEYSGLNQSAQN